MWFSVALMKFHWSGINRHVCNQSECRNCCLYIIIQKIAPQAKSGKYFQIWFFARSGSAPIWGGKKGEFRDWTTGSDIGIHRSSHNTQRRRKTELMSISSKYQLRKPAKYFQHDIYSTFSKWFHKSLAQYTDSECNMNSTHSIQCGRVDFKTIVNENWVLCLQRSKLSFSSSNGLGRSIAKYSSLQRVLNK